MPSSFFNLKEVSKRSRMESPCVTTSYHLLIYFFGRLKTLYNMHFNQLYNMLLNIIQYTFFFNIVRNINEVKIFRIIRSLRNIEI